MPGGCPFVSKKVPVVVGLDVVSRLDAVDGMLAGTDRVERLELRVPDIVGQLLQPRKNMGEARCPPRVSVGRHVVLDEFAPPAGLGHALGGMQARYGWSGSYGTAAGGAITESRRARQPWRGRNCGRGSGGEREGGGGAVVVDGREY